MRVFMMLSQTFAVVTNHDDDRTAVFARPFQIRDEVRQRRIRICDFAIVQMIFVYLRIRQRWFVRIMGIVEVNPHEMRTCRVLAQPRFRVSYDDHTAALDASPARLRRRMFGKVIVKIESSIESRSQVLAVEDHRPDKRCGAITWGFEQLRYRWMCCGQWHSEIRHPMRARDKSGENTCVGCIGDRAGCKSLGEPHTVLR